VLTDFSKESERAMQQAIRIKRPNDVLAIACCLSIPFPGVLGLDDSSDIVETLNHVTRTLTEKAQSRMDGYVEKARKDLAALNATHDSGSVRGLVLTDLSQTEAEQAINFAETSGVHTIFVGSRRLSTAQRLFLGSFSTYIVHHASCNVFVAKK